MIKSLTGVALSTEDQAKLASIYSAADLHAMALIGTRLNVNMMKNWIAMAVTKTPISEEEWLKY